MTPSDRAIVAAAEERDRRYRAYWALETEQRPNEDDAQPEEDRRELLRIVRDLEALLRERADIDDAAAEAEFLRPIGGGL